MTPSDQNRHDTAIRKCPHCGQEMHGTDYIGRLRAALATIESETIIEEQTVDDAIRRDREIRALAAEKER